LDFDWKGLEKYTGQVKLAAVRDYRSGEIGLKAVGQWHGINVSSLRQWTAGYRAHGEEGVRTNVDQRKIVTV
jgi:transposase